MSFGGSSGDDGCSIERYIPWSLENLEVIPLGAHELDINT